ncbi:peptidoglycan DD-metalloendopeptidase family protein [Flavihumibacter rivuli]|uniref:M23 family metallopeptidase n=1 Tax=Flavihumibacter rivuli TaxID=2838156 RepID=UPI001BDF6E67|nr:M23 family metallopeptidase [Flavihumibacter rivuli]ULQ55116.1 peptidoglycan DD-metalloendopeptidase family protein [Flavihumibacter rivuli]
MKKIKYFYNPNTLRYEKLETPLRVRLLRILGFIAACLVTALIIVSIAFRYLDSPKEKILRQQYEKANENYDVLRNQLGKLQQQMAELEKRDNDVYRSIFEASPIPDSARVKEMEKQKEIRLVQAMDADALYSDIVSDLNNLSKRVAFQNQSFDEIISFIKNKEVLLAATPAIQPVNNKDLNRIASGFGYRIDPVYKTVKMHAGLDFAAPQGTPIYATANGTVRLAGNTGNGYGNHVIINHGFGYETLYGHMYRIKARPGQKVKRGEIVGYVGSTGKSTGPHLHYEVHKNGKPLDPVYFFYNDLSPEQYDRLLKMAAASNQSFD